VQSANPGIKHPFGAYDQIFITVWQLWFCFCGASSLMGGQVCLLYMLLALASAFLFGSESLWSRDHILLSQNWDFPFHCLLRLAGSRWRYLTLPPHRSELISKLVPLITPWHRPLRKHCLQQFLFCWVLIHCCRDVYTVSSHSNGHDAGYRKYCFQQFVCCCVLICCHGNLFVCDCYLVTGLTYCSIGICYYTMQ
jgi:hypothetical protein